MDRNVAAGVGRSAAEGAERFPGEAAPPGGNGYGAGREASREASVADLIRGIAEDASTIARQEVFLAKQELSEGLATTAKASSMLVAAGVVALYAVLFLLVTLALVLVELGLLPWAAFGIVTLLLLIVAAVAALLGRNRMQQAKVAPVRAQAELNQTTLQLRTDAQATAGAVQTGVRRTVAEAQAGLRGVPARVRARAADYADRARSSVRRR